MSGYYDRSRDSGRDERDGGYKAGGKYGDHDRRGSRGREIRRSRSPERDELDSQQGGEHGRSRGPGQRSDRDHERRRSRSPRRDDRDSQRGDYSNDGGQGQSRGPGQQGGHGRRGEDGDGRGIAVPNLPPARAPSTNGSGAQIPYKDPATRGTLGRKFTVLVNHFRVETLPVIKIYQYDLRFRVPESSQARGSEKVAANQMARVLVNTLLVKLLGPYFVFDGVSMGWSPQALMPIGESRFTTLSLGSRRDNRPDEVELLIRNTGTLNIGALVNYIKGNIGYNPMGNLEIEPTLKWLNALFRSDPAKTMISRPNSSAFFLQNSSTSTVLRSTGGVLEAIRGVFQTVQIRFSCLTINLDNSVAAFWVPDQRLLDCVCALAGERSPQSLQQNFLKDPGSFFQACGMMLGVYFNVKHLDESRNARKMKFLSWSSRDAESTTFDECIDDDTPRSTSVADYFLRKYGIKLLYPKLPLAKSKYGDMPLELIYTSQGERYRGVLQGPSTADFIKVSTSSATNRRRKIDADIRALSWGEKQTILAHGLSVTPAMMTAKAILLPAPQLVYGDGGSIVPRDGQWNLRGLKLLKPCVIRSWGLICFIPYTDKLDNLGREIVQSFRTVGISVPTRPPSVLVGNAYGDMESIFREAVSKAQNDFGKKPDLIFIILKASSIPVYRIIKQVSDLKTGIPSQVMVAEKVFKDRGLAQYLANISLKANVKLGGKNHGVNERLFEESRWMLIGGDTSMASPSALRRDPPPPITATLCGTWDPQCTAYTSIATFQQSTVSNIIVHAGPMFEELLNRYKEKNNGLLPEHIIYYRDGASESEFEKVRDKEGLKLRELCKASGTRITIIIAVKRHHTRFFAQEMATNLGNVPAGTVIENSSSKNDSFLIAHKDLQGTKRPTRYVSIVDENNLSADTFHRLTYELCSTYARSTTSVSVVPPIYYADQACERARIHLQDTADGNQSLPPVHSNLRWNMYWQ